MPERIKKINYTIPLKIRLAKELSIRYGDLLPNDYEKFEKPLKSKTASVCFLKLSFSCRDLTIPHMCSNLTVRSEQTSYSNLLKYFTFFSRQPSKD